MIIYSFLLITLLLAGLSLFMLLRSHSYPFAKSWSVKLLAVALAAFIYLYGAWVFLSVYTKYVFAICFVLLLLPFFSHRVAKQDRKPRTVVNAALFAMFITLCILYYTGTTGKAETVSLSLPFKHGTYFVFQGGKGLPTNLFHYGFRGAVYAMDIIKLNKAGNRATKIFSKNLEDYATFGDTVYSPCSGIVLRSANDNPDNIPPNHTRGPHNSNSVLIQTSGYYVFMGHMRMGTVMVNAGDSVTEGQPIGCAGNSGFSLEPHLHIQVHKRTDDNIPWYKEPPLFIQFDHKSYLLFQTIKANG